MRDDFLEQLLKRELEQRREPTMQGIHVAKVTSKMDNGDYELSYNGMGQNAPSAPAKCMMPGAGSNRGMHFAPENGDTVVVGFTGGDPNSPIILGGMFNSDSPTPAQANPSTSNDFRTIVSRSGHEITFNDSSGSESVTVKSKGGREVKLDDTAPGKITIKNPGGVELTINDAPPEVKITAPVMITLETAVLNLAAGQLSMTPPTSVPAAPGPTSIQAPISFQVTTPLIQLNAAAITIQGGVISINTTGVQATSTLVIDGVPWASVVHIP